MMQLAAYKGPADGLKQTMEHWAIRVRTLSAYSHCELVIDGMCYSSSPRDGGVRSKIIDLGKHWDVFPIDASRMDEERAMDYFYARQGWKYSRRGVLRFVIPTIKQRPREEFCSQFCAGALGLPNPSSFHVQKLVSAIL